MRAPLVDEDIVISNLGRLNGFYLLGMKLPLLFFLLGPKDPYIDQINRIKYDARWAGLGILALEGFLVSLGKKKNKKSLERCT